MKSRLSLHRFSDFILLISCLHALRYCLWHAVPAAEAVNSLTGSAQWDTGTFKDVRYFLTPDTYSHEHAETIDHALGLHDGAKLRRTRSVQARTACPPLAAPPVMMMFTCRTSMT